MYNLHYGITDEDFLDPQKRKEWEDRVRAEGDYIAQIFRKDNQISDLILQNTILKTALIGTISLVAFYMFKGRK